LKLKKWKKIKFICRKRGQFGDSFEFLEIVPNPYLE